MDINNQNNFSKLINLSLLTTFYNQLKNEFVIYSEYENFYNNTNSSIQQNKKDINSLNTNLSNNYYTKTEIDEDFDSLNQGIMTNYYSKSDIDGKIQVINSTIDSVNQNINNNYYNKQYIDDNFLSLTGGTISGDLTIDGSIIGNLTGTSSNSLESNHSLVSDKVKNKLIFTGYENKEYDGSSEVTINIPNYNTLQYPLIITFNSGESENVNKFTFNGSENKIINITPNSIGAASSSDLSNYLSINGGILNGNLTAPLFIGDLNGNATTASKLSNKLIFNGYSNNSYDGSQEITIEIPTLLSQLTNDSNFATINYVNEKLSTVYKFKGSVANYSDLPTQNNEIGDVWDIQNADQEHQIKAGDNVVWNGSTWDNLGGIVDLSNYYNKDEINNQLLNYLPISGGTLTGSLTAPTFIGNLNGNADTSTNSLTTNQLKNSITFSGGFVGSFDGTQSLNVEIPTFGSTDGSLTITLNGGTTENVNKITFNGGTDKILNITSSLIGAASASELNNYLLLSGGTLTGNLTAPNFIGNLIGNSNSSNIVNHSITFSGYSNGTFNGSQDINISIPNLLSQLDNDTNFATITYVNSKLSSIYKFKGSVENYSDLPTSNNEIGDVWDIQNADASHQIKAGDNVAWTGTMWDNLGGNVDLTNYYEKSQIDSMLNNYLLLSGGTLSGNLTAPLFIGNLQGNAETSSVSNKLINKITFSGGFTGEYDGSSPLNVEIPTSSSTDGTLTIQFNNGIDEGINKFTFNGGTNKTVNITPNSIGAATQNDLSNYLPISGGVINGNLTANTFIGNLNGTAEIANKLQNKLIFNGYSNYSYDGTSEVTVTIPSLLSQLQNDSNFATIDYVNDKISTVYKFKGSVENYSNLPTSDNQIGDVWDIINADPTNNIKAGDNVVWTGTTWDNLGGMVDLSNYYNKSEIDNKLTTINQSVSNINNNLISNYYTKTNIDNKLNEYLPLTGGTLSGQLTATQFNGNLNGNATSSTTATKVSNKLIFTGAINSTYDGSKEITVNIPTQLEGDYLPLSGGTLTGNLNSRSIIPTSNSTYNLGSSTYKYNIVYANTFNGNATSSSIASKVANKLIFTGATTGTYDGSSEITINIPEFQQTNGILTIQLNGGNVEGSNKFTFNGSVNKTVDITPSSIGAVTSSELNNYLSLLGGTINGNLYVNGTITANNLNGELNGNATSANKVNNQLSFIGYQTKSYDGSQAVEIEIPDKTSQLTNDSNFATADYVDNKEFVGLNKDSIIRYPKDLPVPEGYEEIEEQFSALTDANDNLILQAPMTPPQNLLINGDFKINQRGQSSYNALGFTLDDWYATSGRIIVTPLTGGGVRIYNSDNSHALGLMQNTEIKTDSSTPYTVVVEFIDGTVVVLQTNDTTKETSKITDDYAIKIRPSSNNTIRYDIQAYPLKTIEVKNARLYEGSITYPHVEEDDAVALLRCQDYVKKVKLSMSGYSPSSSFGNHVSVYLGKMRSTPTITVTDEGTLTNIASFVATNWYETGVLFLQIATEREGVFRFSTREYLISCEPL